MAMKINIRYGTGVGMFILMFILLLMLFASYSCKTTSRTTATETNRSEVKNDITTKEETKEKITDTSSQLEEKSNHNDIVEAIIEEEFSQPDSAGNQYLKSRKTTKRTSSSKTVESLKTDTKKESEKKNTSQLQDKSKIKTAETTNQETVVKKVDKSSLYSTLGAIAFVLLVVLIAKKIKR